MFSRVLPSIRFLDIGFLPKRFNDVSSANKSLDPQALKTEVKNLYKTLIYISRDWHHDLRPQIKNAFVKNKDVTDPVEIRKLIERGEYVSREITATYRLKKYRALKRRYYSDNDNQHLQDIFKSFSS